MVYCLYVLDTAAATPWKARFASVPEVSSLQESPWVAAIILHPLVHTPAKCAPSPAPNGLNLNMAEKRHGVWFGFGFCGFGQALGSGNAHHSVHSPEPLHASDDICQVSASWSYTALVTRECPHNPNSGLYTGPTLLSMPVQKYPTPLPWPAFLPGFPGPWHPSHPTLPTQVEAGWNCQVL